jgi:hypothetical protein
MKLVGAFDGADARDPSSHSSAGCACGALRPREGSSRRRRVRFLGRERGGAGAGTSGARGELVRLGPRSCHGDGSDRQLWLRGVEPRPHRPRRCWRRRPTAALTPGRSSSTSTRTRSGISRSTTAPGRFSERGFAAPISATRSRASLTMRTPASALRTRSRGLTGSIRIIRRVGAGRWAAVAFACSWLSSSGNEHGWTSFAPREDVTARALTQ